MRLADAVRRQLKGMNPVERENAVRELREVLYGGRLRDHHHS